MPESYLRSFLEKEKFWLPLLMVVSAYIFIFGLGSRELWLTDEPRVAGIGAGMYLRGEFITPVLNGVPFLEKPPLYFWMEAFFFSVFGINEFAARLPSALAACAGVVSIYLFMVKAGFPRSSAFLTGFILAASAQWWMTGRRCIVDMLLASSILWALISFAISNFDKQDGNICWRTGFVLSMAAALMTKGLVGAAIPCVVISSWLIMISLVDRRAHLKIWKQFITDTLLSLVPFAVWLAALYANSGEDAFRTLLITNNFGRFTGGHAQHVEPFWYYIRKLPEQFMPWAIMVPFVIWWHLKRAFGRKDSVSFFLLAWLIIPFILLSVASGKRPVYLLPLHPAAAILTGIWLHECVSGNVRDRVGYFIQNVVIQYKMIFVAAGAAAVLFLPFFDSMLLASQDINRSVRHIFEDMCKEKEEEASCYENLLLVDPDEGIRGAAIFYTGHEIQTACKDVLTVTDNRLKGKIFLARADLAHKKGNFRILKTYIVKSDKYIVGQFHE